MNLENFTEFLKYPSRLYQLSYEELKSLSLQYPYCSNLHLLLLVKSKLEGHPDLRKNLHRAATYAVDRHQLRLLMEDEEMIRAGYQITIGTDEVLELQDLFQLEEPEKVPVSLSTPAPADHYPLSDQQLAPPQEDEPELVTSEPLEVGDNSISELIFAPPAEANPGDDVVPVTPPPVVPEDVIDHSADGIPDAAAVGIHGWQQLLDVTLAHISTLPAILPASPLPVPVEPMSPYTVPGEVTSRIATLMDLTEGWSSEQPQQMIEWEVQPGLTATPSEPQPKAPEPLQPAPLSRRSFNSYQQRYQAPARRRPNKAASPIVPRRSAPAKQVIAASVKEDLGVASETLAELLASQSQYDRAIKMYEHLSLLIPEKSAYFAAKIDAIKNK